MVIIEDTRQKADKHLLKHASFDKDGDIIFRSRLLFGDYALPPKVAVDTKQSLMEIAYNMCGRMSEKKRFAEECFAAKQCDSKLVFLIEDGRFQKPADLIGTNIWLRDKRIIQGEQLYRAMVSMSNTYGVDFRFCRPEDAAKIIKDVLTNDYK